MGGPVNHLLSDGGMSTMIGGAKGVDHGLVGAQRQPCVCGVAGANCSAQGRGLLTFPEQGALAYLCCALAAVSLS